jgi:hypothetical protein
MFGKPITFHFVANWLILLLVSCPSSAFERNISLSSRLEKPSQLMTLSQAGIPEWDSFTHPQESLPGKRQSDKMTRGDSCPQGLSEITALIPTTTMGRILSAQPTFFFYVPVSLNKTVEFELADSNDNTIYQKTFTMIVDRPGIISLTPGTASRPLPLEVGKNYHWYLTIKCDANDNSGNIIISGWLSRVALPPQLVSQLEKSSLTDRLNIYYQEALWYEALSTLAQLRYNGSRDGDFFQKWQEILNAVKLGPIATQPLVPGQFIAK